MKDILDISMNVQRIEILARTLVNDMYDDEDKEAAEIWLAELATKLKNDLKIKINQQNSPIPGQFTRLHN